MPAIIAQPRPITSDPYYISTGVNHTVPTTASYLVLAQPTVDDVVFTVSSGRSHYIMNIGTKRAIVDVITAPNVTLQSGQALKVIWDSASNLHWTFLENTSIASGATTTNYVQASHGRVSGEVGRPLFNGAIYDDADISHWPTGILLAVFDTSTISIAKPGDVVTLSTTLLSGGDAINLSLGRNVWWDKSATLYKQTRMTDSHPGVPAQLYILSVGTGTFTAVVKQFVAQPMRKLAEYTLTGTDVTNKQCGLITAGVAVDAVVFFNGVLVSSLDATFNSLTGVLSWTGLGLDGQAEAGMKVQGLYEPLL